MHTLYHNRRLISSPTTAQIFRTTREEKKKKDRRKTARILLYKKPKNRKVIQNDRLETTPTPFPLHIHQPTTTTPHPRRRSTPVQDDFPGLLDIRSTQNPAVEAIPPPDPRPTTNTPADPAGGEVSGEAGTRGRACAGDTGVGLGGVRGWA